MSIKLKKIEEKQVGPFGRSLLACYEVSHETSGLDGTRLSQELIVVFDPRIGEVAAKLTLTDLNAPSFDAALEKMAEWCDRMAIALREPREISASIPVVIKTQGSCEAEDAEARP
ncbi:hypothetical protein [Chromobacterium paludis]|uniref:Uncharacterized protein n=1 Tax=Chromobacterium paludis TaxID=2605945 RepID=A0A5C1DHK8_9NEIS|nr:hypothetical protein [Chromobacterium paludis]QEL55487.1 hypothetical protein FYK34_07875 [Chromobacterium paludis]